MPWLPTFPALPLFRVGVTGKGPFDWSERSCENAARTLSHSVPSGRLVTVHTMIASEISPKTRNSSQVRIVDVDPPPPRGKEGISYSRQALDDVDRIRVFKSV